MVSDAFAHFKCGAQSYLVDRPPLMLDVGALAPLTALRALWLQVREAAEGLAVERPVSAPRRLRGANPTRALCLHGQGGAPSWHRPLRAEAAVVLLSWDWSSPRASLACPVAGWVTLA